MLFRSIYALLETIGAAMNTPKEPMVIQEIYPRIPKISIDYGIMERAESVLMIPGNFGWNDIGALDMLRIMKPADHDGNICYGETIARESTNNILYATDQLIATVGIHDAIVIQTKDAVLVCDKAKAQQVNLILATL